ncbi:MAG: hypothetical protein ACRCVL_05260, partial [Cetobacterium sp.]
MEEETPQPPPMCTIHLDDVTTAILRQNAHHTPAYWWRRDRVMKLVSHNLILCSVVCAFQVNLTLQSTVKKGLF